MKKIKKEIISFIPYLLLLFLYIGCIWYLDRYYVLDLDDDEAAEMVLSHALSQEGFGKLMTKDWVYSTELRVLNTQIIYSFLFHFFTNWHTVRILGNAIMLLMLLCAVFYLCVVLDLKKFFPIIGAFFIIPISASYWKYVVRGAYLPYIILPILILALFFDIIKSSKNKQWILTLIAILISFGIGLGSIRQIFLFFLPLLLSSGLFLYFNRKEIIGEISKNEYLKFFVISMILFVSSCLGYLVNHFILSHQYIMGESRDYSHNIILQTFSFDRLEEVLSGWLDCFGYHYGMQLMSVRILNNIMPVFLLGMMFIGLRRLLTIRKEDFVERAHLLLILFLATGFALTVLLFVFTDMYFHPRYLIPLSVFSYFIIFLLYDRLFKECIMKRVVMWGGWIFVLGFTFINLYDYSQADLTKDMRNIADVLIERGYYEGYTTYICKYGSGLIEYTNGELNVHVVSGKYEGPYAHLENIDGSALERSEDELWLELKSNLNVIPEGKVFFIAVEPIAHLDQGDALYENGNLCVYGYDDYELLVQDLNSK